MKRNNSFIWFMGLMGKRLPIYLTAVSLSSVGLAVGKIADAYLIKSIVAAAQMRNVEGLIPRVAGAFLLFTGGWLLWRFSIVRYNIEGKWGVARVEKLVFSKAIRLPMRYYEEHHSGDFMSRLIFDSEKAGDIYSSRFRRLADGVIESVVFFIPMLMMNVRLTLCLLGLSCLAFYVNDRFTGPMKAAGKKMSEQNSIMTEKLTNILAGIEIIKMFPVKEKLKREYEEANAAYSRTAFHTNCLSAELEGLNHLFDLAGSLAFLGLGVYFVSRSWIGLGELAAIYVLYGSFQTTFLRIGIYIPQLMGCIANAERIREFLAQEEEEGKPPEEAYTIERQKKAKASGKAEAFGGTVTAGKAEASGGTVTAEKVEAFGENVTAGKAEASGENVTAEKARASGETVTAGKAEASGETVAAGKGKPDGLEMQPAPMLSVEKLEFSYGPDKKVLDGFSMQVQKGECVALVGKSGCGKSTLGKLLLRFYTPSGGRIMLNGTDYAVMTPDQIRERISYVPQEPYLYRVSIAENIAYGCAGLSQRAVSREEIIAAAKAANAHDFIMQLPKGYDTVPGERGNKLSGGERQRIAIARAVIRNAPILLLDEATSALDNESERLVNEAIRNISRERTTIMIAHRSSTIAMADRIVEIPV